MRGLLELLLRIVSTVDAEMSRLAASERVMYDYWHTGEATSRPGGVRPAREEARRTRHSEVRLKFLPGFLRYWFGIDLLTPLGLSRETLLKQSRNHAVYKLADLLGRQP